MSKTRIMQNKRKREIVWSITGRSASCPIFFHPLTPKRERNQSRKRLIRSPLSRKIIDWLSISKRLQVTRSICKKEGDSLLHWFNNPKLNKSSIRLRIPFQILRVNQQLMRKMLEALFPKDSTLSILTLLIKMRVIDYILLT